MIGSKYPYLVVLARLLPSVGIAPKLNWGSIQADELAGSILSAPESVHENLISNFIDFYLPCV